MTNHIVLFEPLMPANTGNIARTCAGTNTELHLIKPLGFSTDDKYMKRAGLDYWDKVKITYHENLPEFLKTMNCTSCRNLQREPMLMSIIPTNPKTIIFCLARRRRDFRKFLCASMKRSASEFLKTTGIFVL